MPCVWVEAWEGSRRMRAGRRILEVQLPVDHARQGSSSWLRVVREKVIERVAPGTTNEAKA